MLEFNYRYKSQQIFIIPNTCNFLDLNYVRDLSLYLCKHNKGCSKLKFDHRYKFYQYITLYIQFIQT